MLTTTNIILASLCTLVYNVKCASPKLVVRDRRDVIPQGFLHSGAASPSLSLDLRIALVSNDMQGLQKELYDVSTPNSRRYGQHLSKEQVQDFVSPSTRSTAGVNEWLESHGLKATPLTAAGDWLKFSVDVKRANEILDAEFSVFTQEATGKQYVRSISYSLPESLRDHVQLIHPTTYFPPPSFHDPMFTSIVPRLKNMSLTSVSPSCASTITSLCLQQLYSLPATPATQPSNRIGVTGFFEQYAQENDLKSFLEQFRTDMDPATTFTLQTLDGGSNPQGEQQASLEADLDIQYTIGVATGVPTAFISVGSQNDDGFNGFLDIINALIMEDSPPQVLTTSYGSNENTIPIDLAINACNAYMQLGARGVSVLFASGDGGVSGAQPGSCSKFVSSFPSGCPYVTSVGATTGIDPETAADFSSGGFSNIFDTPSYQTSAVSGYLSKLGETNSGLFNKASLIVSYPNMQSGRGFPDISAQGGSVETVWEGKSIPQQGTSCSSPIFASVIALLNDELIAAGKPPLGFLNPFLYSNGAAAMNDITTGSNPGCNTNGFPAETGWDPVTGLGTPNYVALKTAIGL